MKKASVLLSLLALIAVPVAAEKPLHFTASETLSYDDNIYLTDKNTKDSFISTTRLGAEYKAPVPSTGLKLAADAGVGYNAYTENHDKNNYWEALGGIDLSNEQFNVGDRLLYTSDPANNELTERKKRLTNTGFISYVTSHEKMFGIGLFADDIYTRYMESEMQYLTRNRLDLGAQLYYNLSAKTHFFVEYMYSDITYRDNKLSNSIGNRFALGVNGQISSKVTGTAKATYEMRDYDHSRAGAHNYNDLVGYYAALTWKPSTKNMIRLSGERKMEETRYGNDDGYNRYFADTLVSLYGAQKLTDKLSASLTLAWENMHYPKRAYDNKRNDDLYIVRPQLDYQFKEWLSAGVWYQFRTRHSDVNRFDYDSNKVGAFVKATF